MEADACPRWQQVKPVLVERLPKAFAAWQVTRCYVWYWLSTCSCACLLVHELR